MEKFNYPPMRQIVRGEILRTTPDQLSKDGVIVYPAMMLPSYRLCLAQEKKLEKNFLIRTHGGLGDVISAEPAIRYAVNNFTKNGTQITIDSYFPELFTHLSVKEIIDRKKKFPVYEDYLVFDTLYTEEVLHYEFFIHGANHVVDHHSLTMWKMQLPVRDRSITLIPSDENKKKAEIINPQTDVIVHAGRTWQSRTVPVWFWNKVTPLLVKMGLRPVLIGKESGALVGNLPIETDGCFDLRDKLSIMESVAVLQRGKVLLTNDSAPHHMAASGDSSIGLITTVRHPDLLMHWRHGHFGWGIKNFSKGGVWELIDMCPNAVNDVRLEKAEQTLVDSWMPDPEEYTEWARSQIRQ